MPIPLNLAEGLEKGEIRRIVIKKGSEQGPPTRRRWLILDGSIHHVTATASGVWKRKKGSNDTFPTGWRRTILSASSTGDYNLFSTVVDDADQDAAKTSAMQYGLPILDEYDAIGFMVGNANAKLYLTVLEW